MTSARPGAGDLSVVLVHEDSGAGSPVSAVSHGSNHLRARSETLRWMGGHRIVDGRRAGVRPGEREAHRVLVEYWVRVLAATLVDDGDGTALEEVAREVAGPRAYVRITSPLIPLTEAGGGSVAEVLGRLRAELSGPDLPPSARG